MKNEDSDKSPTFAERNASNGVEWSVGLDLDPKLRLQLADKYIAEQHLSEADVEAIAAAVKPNIVAAMKCFREKERKAARAKYDADGTAGLFADSRQVSDDIADYYEALLDWSEGDDVPAKFSAKTCAALEKMLSALTLLIYPCWSLNEALTPREIVYLLQLKTKEEVAARKWFAKELRPFTPPEIFCEREVTEEFNRQDELFSEIRKMAYVAAARLKELDERELAIRWLRLLDRSDAHAKVYSCNFTRNEAKAFVTDLRTLQYDTELALNYANLDTTDEIREELD